MKRYVLALDLDNDPARIAEYERYHREVWPEVLDSIRASGIRNMQIYRFADRLVMVIETADDFSFERKAALDAVNEKVQDWERLMWKFQRSLPGSARGEKWRLMDKIFELGPHENEDMP